MRRLIASIAVLCTLAACGSPQAPGGGDGSPAYEGAWRLTEGTSPEGPIETTRGFDITLEFEDDSNLSGRSACNYYGGNYEINGSAFHAGQLGGTDMGCDGPVMEAESRYLSALQDAQTIQRQDDELVLEGPNSRLTFAVVTPPPTAELVETDWKLEGLIEGTGPEGTVSSPAAPATFRMEDDGTFSGTTGCRSFNGKWVESSGQIDVTEIRMEGGVDGCGEFERRQDDLIGGVIGDGFTAEIAERSLTVMPLRGDMGLSYRAP